MIRIDDYPQLKLIAWNRQDGSLVEEAEALTLYERNWHFIDEPALGQNERDLIHRLVQTHGHGVLHV